MAGQCMWLGRWCGSVAAAVVFAAAGLMQLQVVAAADLVLSLGNCFGWDVATPRPLRLLCRSGGWLTAVVGWLLRLLRCCVWATAVF